MPQNNLTIEDNIVVSMEYILSIDDGKEVSRTSGDDPLVYVHGANQIISGLEKELYGLKVGDKKEVIIDPANGYGEHREEEVIEASNDTFPPEFELVVGKGVSVTNKETGEHFIGYIKEIQPETVVLDFNHPLAGKNLHFSVEIVELRLATEEEITHGHAHKGEGGH